MPQHDALKRELISLIPVIAVLGWSLTRDHRTATTAEAAGFVVAILAAIGWGPTQEVGNGSCSPTPPTQPACGAYVCPFEAHVTRSTRARDRDRDRDDSVNRARFRAAGGVPLRRISPVPRGVPQMRALSRRLSRRRRRAEAPRRVPSFLTSSTSSSSRSARASAAA